MGRSVDLNCDIGESFGAYTLGCDRESMASVLIYSVFTAACGFAQSVVQLAVLRM